MNATPRWIALGTLCALFSGCTQEADEAPLQPGILLLAPAGGEVWGGVREVEWVSWNSSGGSVEVEASSDSGANWSALAAGVQDDGDWSWDTASLADGEAFRVRVRLRTAEGVSLWSDSASDFTIDNTAPAAALTSPAGGEIWRGWQTVTWTATEAHRSTADLEISTDSGATWTALASGAADTGSHAWNTSATPDASTARLRVRARDAAGNLSAWSACAADFAVDNSAPAFVLTSPAGGEVWTGARTVAWSCTDPHKSTVDLELSSDSGATWATLAASVPDAGSWSWDTTALAACPFHRVRARARDLAGNVSGWSASSADFKILHWGFARRMGGTGVDRAYAVAADGSGNVYVGGFFSAPVDFRADWGGAADVRSNGGAFVLKVNADGTYGWVREIPGAIVESLAVNAAGDVYALGSFSGTVDFRADWGGGTDSRAASTTDVYLLKILAGGGYGWVRRIGGSTMTTSGGLAVDGSGNVFFSGCFRGTVDFRADWGMGSDSRTPGGADGFLTKVYADGSYAWTRVFGGTQNDGAGGVAADGSGNLYLTGSFTGTVNFAADWGLVDSKSGGGAYLLRVAADGSYAWTRAFPSTYVNAVCAEASGGAVIGGYFGGTADFRADWGAPADARTSSGTYDAFLARVHADGSYGWARQIGGAGALESVTSIARAPSGHLIAAGTFLGTVDFRAGFGGAPDSRSASSQDLFVLRFGPDGSYGWAMAFGSPDFEMLCEAAAGPDGSVSVAGIFTDVLDFRADWGGGTDPKTPASIGTSEAFVLRLR